jgi:uncharacterized protein YjaZ
MGKKNGQSAPKGKAMIRPYEEVEAERVKAKKEKESQAHQEIVAETIIEAPAEEVREEKEESKEVFESVFIEEVKTKETKTQNKPKKKALKKQGIIVKVGLATVTVESDGCLYRLVGVKGNLGDIVAF